ncbi:MAG: hypothetical protein LUE91_03070 [Oscillospiraceae bacterium]|nr:hypothetical protein [Oscillospiraceae bacterium]
MKRSLISLCLGLLLLASLTGCSRDQAPDVTDSAGSTDAANATDDADAAEDGEYSVGEDGQVTGHNTDDADGAETTGDGLTDGGLDDSDGTGNGDTGLNAGTDGAGGANLNGENRDGGLNGSNLNGTARRPIDREDGDGDEAMMDDLVNDVENGAEHVKNGVENGLDSVKNGINDMAWPGTWNKIPGKPETKAGGKSLRPLRIREATACTFPPEFQSPAPRSSGHSG